MPATDPSFQDHFISVARPLLQAVPLCRGQRHSPSLWEIARRQAGRKQREPGNLDQ